MPQVYPLPASSATGFKRVAALGLMCCLIGAEAHTHHPPLVSSSPSARSGIRRDCAAGTLPSRPERPALTLTLIAFGRRCELIVKLADPKRMLPRRLPGAWSGGCFRRSVWSCSLEMTSPLFSKYIRLPYFIIYHNSPGPSCGVDLAVLTLLFQLSHVTPWETRPVHL